MRSCAARILAPAISIVLMSSPTIAGPFGDELSRCLVKSTTPEDQVAFIQWMFSALSLHPAVGTFVSVTSEQREEANKKAGALMNSMLLERCHAAAVDAVKYEGAGAMPAAFQVFGQVAAGGLMNHQSVAAGLEGLTQHVDQARINELLKSAGVPAN